MTYDAGGRAVATASAWHFDLEGAAPLPPGVALLDGPIRQALEALGVAPPATPEPARPSPSCAYDFGTAWPPAASPVPMCTRMTRPTIVPRRPEDVG
jgi:hypothetical protein